MKVAVSQAMPNSAIAEIMPALKTDWSGTVCTSGRPRKDDHADDEHDEDDGAGHVDRYRFAVDLPRGPQVGEESEHDDGDDTEEEGEG